MTGSTSLGRVFMVVATLIGFVLGWLHLAPGKNTWPLSTVLIVNLGIVLVSRDSVSGAEAKFWPAPLMAGTALAAILAHYNVPLFMRGAALICWLGLLCASLLRNRRAVLCAVVLCGLSACAMPLVAVS